ncbi:hypothetical protein K469DRAFT_292132 [Zopfia rhizophila CBS 207.26]|uniref:Uncharacterized protein n=1 Tax=Zopfia rhizophila CBS 207.26 TaxID=1314779 RepID=A0A6A6DLA6_9PEZI|nr:hypothetical protein K469DRAFT_292132 [Zopfia rhizophila CBS 207.26]
MKAGKWDDDATDFSLSALFDPKSMYTYCILRILVKKDLKIFKQRLRELKGLAWYPLFLPAILLEMRIQELPEIIARIRRFLYGIEKTTGTHKNYLRKLGLAKVTGRSLQDVWTDDGFNRAPAELTSIASDCAYYEYACQIRQELLSWLEKMNQDILPIIDSAQCTYAARMLGRKIEFMRAWMKDAENRSIYFGKRAEVQVQTCHSLMAQRDNDLNKRTSDASLELSRFSKMDSNDMRIIAAVTLAFLPATFMATFFSTGFFDFHKDGQIVSSWIWLYWVFTVSLTVLVYFGWYWYSLRKRRVSGLQTAARQCNTTLYP